MKPLSIAVVIADGLRSHLIHFLVHPRTPVRPPQKPVGFVVILHALRRSFFFEPNVPVPVDAVVGSCSTHRPDEGCAPVGGKSPAGMSAGVSPFSRQRLLKAIDDRFP